MYWRIISMKKIFLVAACIVFSMVMVSFVWAADDTEYSATFSWLPVTGENVTGYRILYGNDSGGPYPYTAEVGNPTPTDGRIYYTLNGLTKGIDYYFICVYVDDQAAQSDPSNSVKIVGPPQGLRMIAN
jgi:hypothetical protein